MKRSKNVLVLSACICTHLWLNGLAFAAQTTPSSKDSAFDAAGEALDKAKGEVQDLRDKWDKARLETTLYDKRAKRAYEKWVKAKQKLKDQAKTQKERSELELQLSIEKRKLAYNEWQAAQLRELVKESELKALDQDKDARAVQEEIRKLEEKLGPKSTSEDQGKK